MAKEAAVKNCGTCKWWRGGEYGQCRRYPPVLDESQRLPAQSGNKPDERWVFPITHRLIECGEHKPG